ncbi:hypothetical protein [Streptomyces sp. NPDC059894]|uniref:hypothetical protein n=1 Tax=unclassified Streptomyces TaxID=2593676 RepID=UPI00364A1A9A
MRRTARVLSVAALAGAVLAGAAPAASADPTAETGPATAAPDGSVTVSVSCDPLGAPAPATLEATSDAFAEGTVRLSLIPGGDELTGPVYRGTARIAPADALDAPRETAPTGSASTGSASTGSASTGSASTDSAPTGSASTGSAWTVDGTCPAPPGGQVAPWSATFGVTRAESGGGPACSPSQGADCDSGGGPECAPGQGADCDSGGKPECTPSQGADCDSGGKPECTPSQGADCDSGGKPECAPAPAHDAECDGGKTCAAREHGTSCAPDTSCPKGHDEECAAAEPCPRGHDDPSCGPPSVQHGVRAGAGGAFGVSVPALAAGGLLIAGALGAAGHRLCRRGPREDA